MLPPIAFARVRLLDERVHDAPLAVERLAVEGLLVHGVEERVAVAAEAGWEILENTNFIIDRYREATIALDYYGDSILNSSFDVVFMTMGFLIAARIPWLATLLIALSFEIFTAVMIRDNLSLNVLMLLWPVEAVKTWQGG